MERGDKMSRTNTSQSEELGLNRGLKSRHVTMISLGGTIGTGLLLASGNSVAEAGPGGALLAYGLIGIMVFFLMTSLGEMAAYMPVAGSFSTYATKFIDPALGFALGWNYWYNWAITIAAEVAAVTIVMKYWFPDTASWIWSASFLFLIFFLNFLSVKVFGESEYWFAMIKVVTIIIFLVLSALMLFGILGGHAPKGFTNFFVGDGPFHGGFFATLGIFLAAGFSFQGTELLGVTAGETKDPGKTIPKAVKQVFWRILLFYILAILAIGLLIPYTDSRLINDGSNVTTSPFTLVFENAGIAFAASLMNAVVLTAILSAGNSGLYASSRMLWNLAMEGKAPRIFKKLNHRGVPTAALVATLIVACLSFLTSIFGTQVYTWLLSASGMCGFIAWLGIAWSHYRFRKAMTAQGQDLDTVLPYKSKFFPFGPIFAFVLCAVVVIGQSYFAFDGGDFNWYEFTVSYIGLPIFFALWIGYKIKHKTKFVKLTEADIQPIHK
ncbi:MAG: amino acid permease [Kurthia sp.]|nr:amino acid permease [Candidatus Kurthia equi]